MDFPMDMQMDSNLELTKELGWVIQLDNIKDIKMEILMVKFMEPHKYQEIELNLDINMDLHMDSQLVWMKEMGQIIQLDNTKDLNIPILMIHLMEYHWEDKK